ncbi:hypothetical protein C4544_07555 [candidate division WS5 bacterium]|uniref:Uncharacterized protein n=1 Tax=candidate division WS5 bacterium TaxID=2093353 RepID=A0A419D9R5_9BACT|nr:MAG: hypothetical protein C4544_07555 [candidate division WS5 bacterium]
MKKIKITDIKRFGSNLDAISWNSNKRAEDLGLVEHGAKYLAKSGKDGTDSDESDRLFNKEAAYGSR